MITFGKFELPDEAYLSDGVYDITGIPRCITDENGNHIPGQPDIGEFIAKYPNCYYGCAYQTDMVTLLAYKPARVTQTCNTYQLITNKKTMGADDAFQVLGDGFNHGCNNIILNCPKEILILAEDD